MAIPRFIKPQLARGGGTPSDDGRHGFDVKWDGIRRLIIADKPYRLQNGHLRNITEQFPERDFGRLPLSTVIDEEIVLLKDGVPSFYEVQRRSHRRHEQEVAVLIAGKADVRIGRRSARHP